MLDNYNYTLDILYLLTNIQSIGRFFLFIVGGIVAIIVGSFMIRGTMHLWDKPDSEKKYDDVYSRDNISKWHTFNNFCHRFNAWYRPIAIMVDETYY